jgi:beta-glucosidase
MDTYRNPAAPIEDRIEDLLSKMSLEQKIDQLTCLVTITRDIPDFKTLIPRGIGNVGAFSTAENAGLIADYAISLQKFLTEETPLGIPALIHCEASAGAQFTEANVFPSAIAQASTFDTDLIREMAEVIREQLYAVGFRQALSPVFDISRDPRWGRLTETYGEDPALAGAMGCAFTAGLQGKNLRTGVLATGKHFVGHGMTEGGLNMARNIITERELREVHCKPFQAAISHCGLASVMNSYCSIDGEPVVASKKILTDLLREEMGFTGFVVSDYISVDRLVEPFRVAATFEEGGVKALQAGLDVEYPRPKGFTYTLKTAVDSGSLDAAFIDRAAARVLRAKFALGLFENPIPDKKRLFSLLHLETTDRLNEKIAQKSFILLKNNNAFLPLSKDIKKIALIGPHGDSIRSFFGTFSYPAVLDMTMSREEDGQKFEEPGLIVYDVEQQYPGQMREISPRIEKILRKQFPRTKSLRRAMEEYLPNTKILYAKGINASGNDIGGEEEALACAAEGDVVILTLGGKNGWGITSTVGEGIDATYIGLPGHQEEFARKIRLLNKKTVILHFDGRPLSSAYAASAFDAIMEVWQCGEFGGEAICKTLFGEYNPGGKLPVTVARNAGQIPVYYSLPRGSGYVSVGSTGMIRNRNGYINETAFPLFPFGHGLSYTAFEYSSLSISKDIVGGGETFTVTVAVSNTGSRSGDEVVQLYFSDRIASMVRPVMELAGFKRVTLEPGETATVSFALHPSIFAFLDEDMRWITEAGDFDLMVGKSSGDICLTGTVKVRETITVDPKKRMFFVDAISVLRNQPPKS